MLHEHGHPPGSPTLLRQQMRAAVQLVATLLPSPPPPVFPPSPGCQLPQHQVPPRPHLQDCGRYDQGQDARGDKKDVQHRERREQWGRGQQGRMGPGEGVGGPSLFEVWCWRMVLLLGWSRAGAPMNKACMYAHTRALPPPPHHHLTRCALRSSPLRRRRRCGGKTNGRLNERRMSNPRCTREPAVLRHLTRFELDSIKGMQSGNTGFRTEWGAVGGSKTWPCRC
jgi:hypothetical protein